MGKSWQCCWYLYYYRYFGSLFVVETVQRCPVDLDFVVEKAAAVVVVGFDLVKACGIVGPEQIQAAVVVVVVASGLCSSLYLAAQYYSRLTMVIAVVVGDLSAAVADWVTGALPAGIGEKVNPVFAAFIDEFNSTCMIVNDDFKLKKSFHTYI